MQFAHSHVQSRYPCKMDPQALSILATIFTLLTGGVLGLVHNSLTPDVQPAARDWRIGTLLMAGASLLFAFQEFMKPGFVLPVANFCFFAALALYWFSLQRFCGRAIHYAMWLPLALVTIAIFWFSAIYPNYRVRVLAACLCWMFYSGAATYTLQKHGRAYATASRRILVGIYVAVFLLVFVRFVYFAFAENLPDHGMTTNWAVNYLSVMMASILPVVGTTVFSLMCFERIRGQWERAAATDYLTGLPNRRTIAANGDSRFQHALRARPKTSALAVAVIDIDYFKSINDRFGHDVGDQALKHVAEVLRTHARGTSMVGRLGGEEFVVLFDTMNVDEAMVGAERLRNALEQNQLRLDALKDALRITASFGVAAMSEGDTSFDALLQRADVALYRAKQGGRNRVVLANAL
jgi:diguanylate cyclase (GGDEF)-like protein